MNNGSRRITTDVPLRSVLLVDDDPDVREAIRGVLEGEAYLVVPAADGRAAIAAATRHMPTVAIVDILLPDMNGEHVAQQLRALPGCSKIPLIGMSAFPDRVAEARARTDFNAVLIKPFDSAELMLVLSLLIPPE